MSKLYLVPTPIGNLGDITLRSIEVLKNAGLILAEDTRKTGILLKHYEISVPMQSHHQHNEHKTLENVISRITSGTVTALVTDAGTPGISDPGFLLVRECIRREIPVECLPGPTAFVPALVMSGLPCDRFYFAGFLPHKKGRQSKISELAALDQTFVLYESPFRLLKTLRQLSEAAGADRQASVSRELSKIHEETLRGTLEYLVLHFTENNPRGEIVIVVSGKETE